ncbi:MAG: dihydrofolate reductase family protein [Candidatus Limnocylindrales bacterium]
MTGRSEGLPLEPLWQAPDDAGRGDAAEVRGGVLPPGLANRFAGELTVELRPDRPSIVANFVSTLDGAVSLGPSKPSAGGGEISGFSEADRFMMSLVRGLADVVVVGAGTVRVGRKHIWTARFVEPELAGVFARWRSEMGLAPQPTTIIVTASGDLDPTHAGLNDPEVPVVVATTPAGAEKLGKLPLAPHVRVQATGDGKHVSAGAVLEVVRGTGARLALCEGGPHLFGDLLKARLIDGLFLTLAPQVVGRDATAKRLALIEGTTFGDGSGRWANLAWVRHAGDDLFLHYRFQG